MTTAIERIRAAAWSMASIRTTERTKPMRSTTAVVSRTSVGRGRDKKVGKAKDGHEFANELCWDIDMGDD